jgi:hypothetical protein
MTTVAIGGLPVLELEDELVDHDCPLHADVELGDLTALSERDRSWLVAACSDLHVAEEEARRLQVALTDIERRASLEDMHRDTPWVDLTTQARSRHAMRMISARLESALKWAKEHREHMRRVLVGETLRPASGLDLWDRTV